MVKQVKWSARAQQERKAILQYWISRNKSATYSKKLDQLFRNAIARIKQFPNIGKPTADGQARIKVVRDYLLIYELQDETIYILTIWDTRQDPENLNLPASNL